MKRLHTSSVDLVLHGSRRRIKQILVFTRRNLWRGVVESTVKTCIINRVQVAEKGISAVSALLPHPANSWYRENTAFSPSARALLLIAYGGRNKLPSRTRAYHTQMQPYLSMIAGQGLHMIIGALSVKRRTAPNVT